MGYEGLKSRSLGQIKKTLIFTNDYLFALFFMEHGQNVWASSNMGHVELKIRPLGQRKEKPC